MNAKISDVVPPPEWKRELSSLFRDLNVISSNYTGKITLNISNGVLVGLERTDRVR